jgi:hypothetical protein
MDMQLLIKINLTLLFTAIAFGTIWGALYQLTKYRHIRRTLVVREVEHLSEAIFKFSTVLSVVFGIYTVYVDIWLI